MTKLICFCTLLSSLCFYSRASGGETYSVSQLLKLALDRSPEVRATELDADSLTQQADIGALWEDPVLELGFEQSHQPVNPPTGDTKFGKLAVSQLIPRPGRMQARQVSLRSRSRVGKLEAELFKIETTTRILKTIYAFKIASERWTHSRERVARIKTVDTFIRSRPFVSPQRQAEAIMTRSKLAILEKQVRQFEVERVQVWNELKILTGLEEEPQLNLQWFDKLPPIEATPFLIKAESTNPEVRLRTMKVDAQKAQAALEKADAWSGLTLTGSYADGAGANPEKNFGLGVALPLPFFNGNRAAIRFAEMKVSAEAARLDWAKLRLKASVETAVQKVKAAAKSVEALPVDHGPAIERAMAKIDEGFKRGQVELITYLEADAQHFENFNEALESQMEYLVALSDLYFLTGEVPPLREVTP